MLRLKESDVFEIVARWNRGESAQTIIRALCPSMPMPIDAKIVAGSPKYATILSELADTYEFSLANRMYLPDIANALPVFQGLPWTRNKAFALAAALRELGWKSPSKHNGNVVYCLARKAAA